jgi:shikimate kinase
MYCNGHWQSDHPKLRNTAMSGAAAGKMPTAMRLLLPARAFSNGYCFKGVFGFAANCFPVAPSRYIAPIAMGSHDDLNSPSAGPAKTAPLERSVVLVGMMGVGKTSIGKRLAARLGCEFVDADEEIETAAGMTIAEIFEKFGEPYFRDGERRVVARLIEGEPKIIATGGGAFVNDATRALIRERALSIWLDADVHILADRVSRRNNRPLLKGRDPVEVLTELGRVRNPLYAEANIHIRSDASPHARTVENILKAISA